MLVCFYVQCIAMAFRVCCSLKYYFMGLLNWLAAYPQTVMSSRDHENSFSNVSKCAFPVTSPSIVLTIESLCYCDKLPEA